MNSLLHRWADGVMEGYELDDGKRAEVRETAAKRWSGFLKENRSKIQPLLNEFIEMRVAVEPPTKETVQAWARRALPVFDQACRQLTDGMDDFRKALNPVQQAKFERDVLELGIGVQVARRKLQQWQEGNVDVDEFWARPNSERRERREQLRQVQSRDREGAGRTQRAAGILKNPRGESNSKVQDPRPETDQIALELHAWERYVTEFIQTYNLDEGQRTATVSCLSELKERATAHRDRRREDIIKLEHRIKNNSGTDKELAEIKQRLIELYGPIDEMFRELQRRLEPIPTAHQRATAHKGKQNE